MSDKMPDTLHEFFRQLFIVTTDITEAQSKKMPVKIIGDEYEQKPWSIEIRDGVLIIEVLH